LKEENNCAKLRFNEILDRFYNESKEYSK
jgi:hypothetical protein